MLPSPGADSTPTLPCIPGRSGGLGRVPCKHVCTAATAGAILISGGRKRRFPKTSGATERTLEAGTSDPICQVFLWLLWLQQMLLRGPTASSRDRKYRGFRVACAGVFWRRAARIAACKGSRKRLPGLAGRRGGARPCYWWHPPLAWHIHRRLRRERVDGGFLGRLRLYRDSNTLEAVAGA